MTRFSSFQLSMKYLLHRLKLFNVGYLKSQKYKEYLKLQLKRSLLKNVSRRKHFFLIEQLKKLQIPNSELKSVLCIGSRNTDEIIRLQKLGFANVQGIDLFSNSPLITIMDMHKMKFQNDSFDIIYCSHSLEHAFDINQVIQEMIRVAKKQAYIAIEVPVNFNKGGADLIDFGSKENLHSYFSDWIYKIQFSELLDIGNEKNDKGTPIIRTIFQLN